MALELIQNQTLGSNSSTITFNSLSGYTHLFISGQFNLSASSTAWIRFNSDSTANNYMYRAQVGSPNQGNSVELNVTNADSMPLVGYKVATTNNSSFEAYVLDYAGSKWKNFHVIGGNPNGNVDIIFGGGAWKSTSAITSLTIHTGTNFVTGSSFALYGMV